MKLYAKALAFGAILLFSACSKDEDGEAPLFKSYEIDYQTSNPSILSGERFLLMVSAEDDENLSRLYLRIESDQDDWYYYETFAMSGNSANIQTNVELPSDATPGPCTFILSLEDAAGNVTKKTILGEIRDNRPQVNLTSPSPDNDGKYYFVAGMPVLFNGTITDNEDISRIVIRVKTASPYIGGPQEIVNEEILLNGSNETLYNFDGGYSVMIPQNAINVNYRMTFSVFDNKGNFQVINSPVEVQP